MMENIFKQDAKSIVDMLFENQILNPKLTRDDMAGTEEFISYCMQSRFESYLKIEALNKRILASKKSS